MRFLVNLYYTLLLVKIMHTVLKFLQYSYLCKFCNFFIVLLLTVIR